jgi:hypothetical protein
MGPEETGQPEIYVSSFPEARGKWQVSSSSGHTPRWRRDGHELFFSRTDGVLMAAEVHTGAASFKIDSVNALSTRRVFQNLFSAPYDVFPDGQRFIMSAVKPDVLHAPLTLINNWTAELLK